MLAPAASFCRAAASGCASSHNVKPSSATLKANGTKKRLFIPKWSSTAPPVKYASAPVPAHTTL
jgi:hypothetical protein